VKYINKIIYIFIIVLIILSKSSLATESEILESQQAELNISEFINETEKYTKNVLTDISMENIFNSALSGKVDNDKILSKILSLFGKELKEAITVLRQYFSYNYNT
jgi:hypothetical protein